MKRRFFAATAAAALCGAGLAALAPAAVAVASAKPVHIVKFHGGHLRIGDLTQVYSTNWAGYADDNSTGNTYMKATGSWVQKAVTCTKSNDTEIVAQWVGLDGYNSSTVEQLGTIAECINGATAYGTWWELYPTNSIQIVDGTLPIGTHVTATVSYNASTKKYTMALKSKTAGVSFTKTATCSTCARSSAEWISEPPCCVTGSVPYPMPNYGTEAFTGAKAEKGGTTVMSPISAFPDDGIATVNQADTAIIQQNEPLNSAGTGFSIKWLASS